MATYEAATPEEIALVLQSISTEGDVPTGFAYNSTWPDKVRRVVPGPAPSPVWSPEGLYLDSRIDQAEAAITDGVLGPYAKSAVDEAAAALPISDATQAALDAITPSSGDVVMGGASGPVHIPYGIELLQAMDIWDPTTVPPNYTTIISDLDAATAGKASKEIIGTGSDGTTPIYAYTAGASNAPHALIIGGTHGNEQISVWAVSAFFREFVNSMHPVMVAMRQQLRLTVVPCLTNSSYPDSRYTANGVDCNRDYPTMWPLYTSTEHPKGATPWSQPESVAIRNLIDNTSIACVIDCHQGGSDHLSYLPPIASAPVAGNVIASARAQWQQRYQEAGVTLGEFPPNDYQPTCRAWATRYLRWEKDRSNTMVATIEGLGGTYNRTRLRAYCGYIHMYLACWLLEGQFPILTPTSVVTGFRGNNPYTLQTDWDTILFDGSNSKRFIDVPVRAPGRFEIDLSARAFVSGSATGPVRIEMAIGWGQSPAAGGDVPRIDASTEDLVRVDVGPNTYATISHSIIAPDTVGVMDDVPVYRAQVYAKKSTSDAAWLSRVRLRATHIPDTEEAPQPSLVSRSS